MDSSFKLVSIYLPWSIVYLRGHRLIFFLKIIFFSLKIIFVLPNSEDPDVMSQLQPHLGVTGIQGVKP